MARCFPCRISGILSNPIRRSHRSDALASNALAAFQITRPQGRGAQFATPPRIRPAPPRYPESSNSCSLLRQALHSLAWQQNQPPIIEKRRPKRFIELDGRVVPAQHFPAHGPAVLAFGDIRDISQQGFADPFTAELRADKKVLQEQLWPLPGAIEAKEKSVPSRLPVPFCYDRSKLWINAESIPD